MNQNSRQPPYIKQLPATTQSRPTTHCNHQWSQPYYPLCAWIWCVTGIGILCCLRMKVRTCSICHEDCDVDNGQDVPLDSSSYRTGFAIGAVSEVIHNRH
ncbi:hypothetical protein BC833DRAFT_605490 [Globomyces pollinis-pini]|nr:hypothetical protein BC833DRAFT_605490 [Globomyces pollinis-pini]